LRQLSPIDRKTVTAAIIMPVVMSLILFSLLGVAHAQSPMDEYDEYRVKAAFLFHFAQLVDWPPGTLGPDEKSIVLCTYGDDPFHGDLEEIEGRQIQSRFLRVRHLKETKDARSCQILFIGRSEGSHLSTILAQLRGTPVLTVGEGDKFLQQGGIIGFCWEGNKVRFGISLDAAERAKLKISSRLLLLAKTVAGNLRMGG
jgi:hypothetical protein